MKHEAIGSGEEAEEPTTSAEPGRREVLVQTRVFLGIGVIVTAMAVIYLTTAYEAAGSVMLVVTAGLSFVCGGYLLVHLRSAAVPAGDLKEGTTDPYLPHASIWPFWLGAAAFLVTNGLILGTWFLVPGGLLMIAAVAGFIAQSRARS